MAGSTERMCQFGEGGPMQPVLLHRDMLDLQENKERILVIATPDMHSYLCLLKPLAVLLL